MRQYRRRLAVGLIAIEILGGSRRRRAGKQRDGKHSPTHRRASAELRRLQVIVGLDDLAQAILARAVAAVRVGMVALHQLLEARLDPGRLGVGLEPERVERLALRVAHRARFYHRPFDARARTGPELTQHLEWIVGAAAIKAVGAAVAAPAPGRTS